MKVRFFLLAVLSFFMFLPVDAKKPAKVIAHRGYWKCEGSAQNSLYSFNKAAEIKAYGSEFDVHMTADNVLVVFHDNKIEGIEIQKVPYATIKDKKLANGEKIPTLNDFLDNAKKTKKIKLIFELKSHATAERDHEAARACVEMVNAKKLTKRVEYIAFSLEAAKELHRVSPKTPVFYLNGDLSPKEIKAYGFAGMDYQFNVLLNNPHWFDEAKKLKLKINAWTVDDMKIASRLNELGADFITSDLPEEAMKVVNSKK